MTIVERVKSWASGNLNGSLGVGPRILPADITDLLLVPSADDTGGGEDVVLVFQYLDKDGEMDAVSLPIGHDLVELANEIMEPSAEEYQ